jgi:DNA-binding PadR family transcriptional regulator
MTDFAILGFLMYGPKSGYDIKRYMSMSTAQFYEASYGSIYPSLERMAEAGLIEAERSEGSGRLRRIYSIKAAGKKAFLEWLASPLDVAKGPSRLLLRLFFMGCLERGEAKKILARFARTAAERKEWLVTATDDLPEEPDFFQASTQRFGLAYYAFLQTWLESLGAEVAAFAAAKGARSKRTTKGERT